MADIAKPLARGMAPSTPTARSAVGLAAAIRRRELSATQVVEAHIAVLLRTGPQLNAVAADSFAKARDQARALDQEIGEAALRGRSLDFLAPLAGVPFTITESIAVRGMPNSAGVPARRDYRAPRSATVVKRLVDAGAIPLAVTNPSELNLWIESDNPLYGRTSNPYDHTRTAGGACGGEGAAVGCGGSPFGVGTDLAGSIRIPALFCGVFGHKPSPGLIPTTGIWPPPADEAQRLCAIGPLARRAEDLLPLLQVMAGPDDLDPQVVAANLTEPSSVSLDGLRVTLVEDSSLRPLARELRDARERAAGALAGAGADVRTVSLPSWRTAALPVLAALMHSGAPGTSIAAHLNGTGEPRGALPLLFGRGRHTLPARLAALLDTLPSSEGGRARLQARAEHLVGELREAIGDGVLLHPAHPTLAPHHGRTYGRPWLLTPAAIFNLAGVPVTQVPLGLSRSGLPVGVQVAAAPFADHVTIAIALELEAVFGGWRPPAGG